MVDILVGSFFVHTKGSLEAWEDSHSAKRGALFPVVKHVNSSDQHYQRTSVSTDAASKYNKWGKVPKEIFNQCTFIFFDVLFCFVTEEILSITAVSEDRGSYA